MPDNRDVLEQCFELAREGQLIEAEAVAEGFTRSRPNEGSSWVALGLLRYRRQDLLGACDALETAGLLVPLDPPSRSILAECFARTGHPELAKFVYSAMSTDPMTSAELLPSLAAGLGYLGEFASALGVCLELARRSPDLPEAHFGVAFYLKKLGRSPESVLPIVARAHELAPDVPLYRVSLAALLDHVGHREEARELLLGLDLDAVSCRCCIQRMSTIFLHTGESSGPGEVDPDRPS